ncbi:hypothetical protein IAD21_03532 [Abditibacteriota bacterium]|nr:hypothetical protein IAD21_03532 [Abditibacteriota bacterium]
MDPIETSIESVTVYTDRALITRRGEVQLTGGASEVLVAGLPLDLEVESLRASGRGEVGVRIIGVEARERPLTEANNATARDVQRELETAQDAGNALGQSDYALQNRLDTLQKLARDAAKRFADSLAKGQASLEQLTQLLDYVAAQTAQINRERAAVELQKRDNAALQLALSERLKQLRVGARAVERIVVVLVEASGQGNWQLELSYIVGGAWWTPLYDARVATTPEKERFQLTLSALVSHHSSDDWNDVALTLSTARPGLGTLPPKLDPVWVDVPRSPAPPISFGRAKAKRLAVNLDDETFFDSGVGGMLEDLRPVQSAPASAPAPQPIEAEQVEASVESEGATVEFVLPHRLSIPGDGQTHRVAIATREFPAKFDFFAVPKRVEVAYLRTTATNTSVLSLLQGEVSIFRDGVFVGKATLKSTAPNGEFKLFLGPDEQVRAKREMTLREADKNFIGSQKRVHFAYSIEVQNLKARSVKLSVQDQIPVSRSENIKVKLRGSAPEVQAGELGLLNWELQLAPNEKRTIRFDFGVEAPRETTILGLSD